jgi:hypothetical protein
MDHNENILPKWAQERFSNLRREINRKNNELEGIKQAEAILQNKDWFTLTGPCSTDKRDFIHLWILTEDHPFPVCAIGREDIMLIGRKNRRLK